MNNIIVQDSNESKLQKVKEAMLILKDNGIKSEDDQWVIAEAIWDAYRNDEFPDSI